MKTIFLLIVLIILGFLIFISGNFLIKEKVTLNTFTFGELFEEMYNHPFQLSEADISKLLKDNLLKKDKLDYFLTDRGSPDNNLTIYTLIVSQELDGYRSQASEGVIAKNKSSGAILQLYLPTIRFVDYLDRDINKDGVQDLVIEGETPGNSSLSHVIRVFEVTKEGFNELLPELNADNGMGISQVTDLNKDGIYEIIVTDNAWEISNCTDHSSGPLRFLVYSWDNGVYKDSSEKFSKFYQEAINIDLIDSCSDKKEFCFGPALGKYFAYKQAGREKEGWQTFLKLTDGVQNYIWPSMACRSYLIKHHEAGKLFNPPSNEEIPYPFR